MESGKRRSPPSHRYEILAAVVLGVLAIASFVAQAATLSAKTTPLETVLYNLLQFLLTTGFAWFSTRAASRAEFEESLKRFAVSAYRRVSDIDKMVQRLQSRIARMKNNTSQSSTPQLDVIGAIVDDTAQVVTSSIADWADVIGDELIALEAIKDLERQRNEAQENVSTVEGAPELDHRLQEIDKRIAELVSALPPKLQLEAKRDESETYRKAFAADWMADRHQEEDGLKLVVVAGQQYKCDRDPSTLADGELLYTKFSSDGGIDVVDAHAVPLGRVLNNSPLDYAEFREAVQNCYGAERLPLRFRGVLSTRNAKNGLLSWYRVSVEARPDQEGRPTARKRRPAV